MTTEFEVRLTCCIEHADEEDLKRQQAVLVEKLEELAMDVEVRP